MTSSGSKQGNELDPRDARIVFGCVLDGEVIKEEPGFLIQGDAATNDWANQWHMLEGEVGAGFITSPCECSWDEVPLDLFLAKGGVMRIFRDDVAKPSRLDVSLDDHLMDVPDEFDVSRLPAAIYLPKLPEPIRVGLGLPFLRGGVGTGIALPVPIGGDPFTDVHVLSMAFDPRHLKGGFTTRSDDVG